MSRLGRRISVPAGFTLLEFLLVVVLSGIVLAAGAALLGAASQGLQDMIEVADQGELRRTIAVVLQEELGRGAQDVDWDLESPRAVRLRAFRGEARGCAVGADGKTLVVLRRGERHAEAIRDSVLILEKTGDWRLGQLHHIRTGPEPGIPLPTACQSQPGERLERWEVKVGEPAVHWVPSEFWSEAPFFFRYFESGRYSLEDKAFRYRRGVAGRQPLTVERVAPVSGFHEGSGGLAVDLVLLSREGVPLERVWQWTVLGGRPRALLLPPKGMDP